MQNVVVILGGAGGSGRSTIAKQLEAGYGFKRSYGGLRQVISKLEYKGIKSSALVPDDLLIDFQENYLPNHPEIDLELDAQILSFASNTPGKVVIESMTLAPITKRLNLPYVRVWVNASEDTRTKRLLKRHDNNDTNIKEVTKILKQRTQDNKSRYMALYGFDFLDYQKYYDFIFDTDNIKLEDMAKELLNFLNRKELF